MSKEQWIAEIEELHQEFVDGHHTEEEWRTELKAKGFIDKDFETDWTLLDVLQQVREEQANGCA